MSGYESLMNYYHECFAFVDCFHFNSEVSKAVYTSCLPDVTGKVVPITHSGIKDNRKKKSFDADKVKIGFIGSEEPFKGLPLLIEILQEIGTSDKWDLSVWGCRVARHPSLPIYYRGKFKADTMRNVYDDMDVLIVPSVWKETFSLVTLEALSYGVPVIVSDNVGAQDIVKRYDNRFVFHDKKELAELIKTIIADRSSLRAYNLQICDLPWNHDMKSHAIDVINMMYRE